MAKGVGKKRKIKTARATRSNVEMLHWKEAKEGAKQNESTFLKILPMMTHFQKNNLLQDRTSSCYSENFSPSMDSNYLVRERMVRPKTSVPKSSVAECLTWREYKEV
ncbi:hypothetical protein Ciccas_006114 [Cichlidogyrus casuarinus]|uniref:Uncharacterized protein n=1 Tax=Cichlidogyrus casuarinus TaxID=1844966 RepID=A0ABD2Q6S2_9PLAT